MINLENVQNIHFIGIGGIGISAIARMMLLEGKIVSGSDTVESIVTEVLSDHGADIVIGHATENIKEDTDLVIYTIAVTEDNPELKKARELSIPLLTYPEALGLLSKNKYTIAVAGTHGKTTTTGMIAHSMLEAGLDPSVIIGSFLKGYKSNFIAGKSNYFVLEACEYQRSFLHIKPDILVITNIEEDHLDYYKDLDDIQSAFREIIKNLPKEGYVICNPNDKNLKPVLKGVDQRIVDYTVEELGIELKIPGKHNIENAKATLSVLKLIDVAEEKVLDSLEKFNGTWRRSDYLGVTEKGAIVYDDYAHHPSEIQTTLSGFALRFSNKKIIVVFQPHLHSRTKTFFKEFSKSFIDADEVIFTPIYEARRESNIPITSEMLSGETAKHHKNVSFMSDFYEIERLLKSEYDEKDLIITMGAGNIYQIGENIICQKST